MERSEVRKTLRRFWSSSRWKRLTLAFAALSILPLVGMAGLVLIADWPPFDAFYMAVTTLTTVGFGEIHPLGTPGRAFIIVYLVFGLGLFLYALTVLGETIITLSMERNSWRRRMDAKLKSLGGHVIVCGCGRMGRRICEDLYGRGTPFVVVDLREEFLADADIAGWNHFAGDATHDEVLERCGVRRARGVVAALSTDADNLLLIISARLLNPGIRIVSRVNEERNIPKLERAGAHEVICMYRTGAEKLVEKILT